MRIITILFVLVFIGIQFFSRIINLLVDWHWFTTVGYFDIFLTILKTKAVLGIGAFALSFGIMVGSALIAIGRGQWFSHVPSSITGSKPITFDNAIIRVIFIGIAVFLSLGIGFFALNNWQTVLQYIHQTPVGTTDPIFNKDISFYFFTYPLLRGLHGLSLQIIVPTLLMVIAIYAVRGKLRLKKQSFGIAIDQFAKTQVLVLLALLTLLVSFGIYLTRFQLLFSPAGIVHGIAYTDMHARLPLLTVQFWASIVLAAGFFITIAIRDRKLLIGAGTIFVLAAFANGIYPPLLQHFVVAPNELVKETPFIINHIAATRQAYGLDTVDTRTISTDEVLTADDIAANETTIKNVRLWDRGPLLDTFSQIQEIRTYYDFASIDDDRYTIDGEVRQVMLSPRELSPDQLPNRNFINEHLIFTHGYGLTLGPINQVTPEGLPVLFVKDIPPKSTIAEIQIERPEIYYGERTSNYVFTNTRQQEFNYPSGDDNTYSVYDGAGGITIGNIWKKLLLAIKFSAPKIFLSNDITNESSILINRQILDRVRTIAPFLTYDSDPYMVVVNGRLLWIVDAYTTNRYYPYAQPETLNGQDLAYARNAVKAVIDAYDGTVSFYIADIDDPVITTYAKIFSNTFQPLSAMSEDLVAHIRYPTDIFQMQARLYQVYHMQNPNVFYNQEDKWEMPQIRTEGANSLQPMADLSKQLNLRHLVMKLPGEESEEFVLINPFTPKSKDNLIAWLAARSDVEHYGKLVVYQFPKQKLIFGPQQVIARINQNADISRQITLWDQRGSQVIQGPLLVIPIEESLIYVRPLYLRADAGRIPELKRVIVAYENSIAMEETLEPALARIFGDGAEVSQETDIPEAEKQEITKSIEQAQQYYNAALHAQQNGDWSRYGEEIRKLGEVLDILIE